jgi:hypothetical protein
MYSIKNARKDKHDGKIIHEIPGQDDKTYLSIRAGLSWPNKSAPAYYCILGQEDRQNQFKRNPIAFFYEGQSKNLNLLLDKLTDHAKMVLCEQIWVDLTGDWECFRDSFIDYCEETETRGLYLRQAPWPENFSYGLGLINDWLAKKSLEIEHGTTLARQLGKIPEDLSAHTAEPEVEFFAVNALRYALCAFQKYPWRPELEDIDYGPPENYPGYYDSRFSL